MIYVHCRWMIRRDLPEVLAIEQASFGEEGWTEEDFLQQLRERNVIGMVAGCSEKIVGYMIYGLHKSRLSVVNLAVDPSYRRQKSYETPDSQRTMQGGVGSALVRKLIGKLSGHRRKRLTVLVRERNLGAQLFFRSLGLLAEKLDRRAYGTDEDGIKMAYTLPQTELFAEEVQLDPVNRIAQHLASEGEEA